MSLRETYEPRIRQALEDIKEALARQEVVCETLTASEVPNKIREIELNKDNYAGSTGTLFDDVEGIKKSYDSMWGNTYSNVPANIVFTNQKAPDDATTTNWTANGSNGVVKWRDNSTNTLYISTQNNRKIVLPEDSSHLFLVNPTGNNNITSIDLKNVDSTKVTNMNGMFTGNRSLKEIKNLGNLDTSNVTNFSGMFDDLRAVQELDVSGFNTDQATDLNSMFRHCEQIESLNLSGFKIDQVNTTYEMFRFCSKLKTIYANDWTSNTKATSTGSMFEGCSLLPNYDRSKTDISMAKWKENGGYFTNPAEKPS